MWLILVKLEFQNRSFYKSEGIALPPPPNKNHGKDLFFHLFVFLVYKGLFNSFLFKAPQRYGVYVSRNVLKKNPDF